MDLERLVIKVFHLQEVVFSEKTKIHNGVLHLQSGYVESLQKMPQFQNIIQSIDLKIIAPKQTDVQVNSVMDVLPISTKVLGQIGYGTTYTLSGAKVLLTGMDEIGQQIGEFGDSHGLLSQVVQFNKAGTPKDSDYIILFNVVVYKNTHFSRATIDLCHEACDIFVQTIREELKKLEGSLCTEKHEFYNRKSSSAHRKKIVILKQVAGQGAMYDTRIFPQEPSGYQGGYSIIDCMNMPVFISANEYRDGAVRAMH